MTGILRFVGLSALACAMQLGCSKKPPEKFATGTGSATAAAPAASPAPASAEMPHAEGITPPEIPTPPELLHGFDPCLVGVWKGMSVTMRLGPLNADGGEGVQLSIAERGIAALDFTPMTEVRARTSDLKFDFRYAGKAFGKLRTPARGTLRSSEVDYTKLTVSVSAKLESGDAVELFKNRPLAELVAGGPAPGIPAPSGAPSAAPAPLPSASAAAAAGPQVPGGAGTIGVEPNPVFGSNLYTCADSALKLYGKDNTVRWLFVKTEP